MDAQTHLADTYLRLTLRISRQQTLARTKTEIQVEAAQEPVREGVLFDTEPRKRRDAHRGMKRMIVPIPLRFLCISAALRQDNFFPTSTPPPQRARCPAPSDTVP